MEKKRLFGIDVSVCEFDEFISESVNKKNGYSCFLNSHMIYEFYHKEGFMTVLDKASFVLADGMPALYSLNFFNKLKQERIAGNDVIFSLIDKAKNDNLKVFLIGATEDVLNVISERLTKKGVIHDTYSPPFLPIHHFDFKHQADLINGFGADIVLVGLGCPKQEIWMFEMSRRINAHMYGLGGAFLLYAGVDSRAPKFMRDLSLEWLYRLSLEPRRLFSRYLVTNSFFCKLFFNQLFKIRRKSFVKF